MNTQLFAFALEQARPSHWEPFEELGSRFLVSEFPELRTMASPSGDGGRDSELFSPTGNPVVAIQYSVSTDWRTKIRSTIKRITGQFPTVRVLLYVTSKKIGASGDQMKAETLQKGIILDSAWKKTPLNSKKPLASCRPGGGFSFGSRPSARNTGGRCELLS
ncbi:hypothetical protein, partial [Thiococcus pfennigii]|uniref:hypothetical protein n=1 Tax=Thiococcus pfennigii TaxID=1057 RepID=UPI001A91750C